MEIVNFSISEIIEIYNAVSNTLFNKVVKVNIKSYRQSSSSSSQNIFIEAKNGSYWIVKTEDEKEWLLPSNKLTVNQFNQDSIQSFFEFQSYDNSENREFILLKPARVSLIPNASEKEWKLEEKGTLNFDPNFPLATLRSQRKQIQQEKEQLTSQVSQLVSDALKYIRSSLVTKDEFNRQLEIIKNQLKQLSSQQQSENKSLSSGELKELQENQINHTKIINKLEEQNSLIKSILSEIEGELANNKQERSQIQNQLNEFR